MLKSVKKINLKVPKLTVFFWIIKLLTTAMGASFADWFDATKSVGGLGVSTWGVGVGLMALIVIFVIYLAKTRVDIPDANIKL